MSLAVAYTRAQLGLRAPLVIVETHLTPGLPSVGMVGLPETAVRESKERVRSAILNAGFEFPQRRMTMASLRRTGSGGNPPTGANREVS